MRTAALWFAAAALACFLASPAAARPPRDDRSDHRTQRCPAMSVSADGAVTLFDPLHAVASPERFGANAALWVTARGVGCSKVAAVLSDVLRARDELVALEGAGWHVRRIDHFRLGGGRRVHQVWATQSGKRILYVRLGRRAKVDRSVYRAGQRVNFYRSAEQGYHLGCTSAFVLRLRSGDRSRMVGLTAGHCSAFPILGGKETENAVRELGGKPERTTPLGPVLANTWHTGGPDALLFGLEGAEWGIQQIDRGRRAPLRVVGAVPTRRQRNGRIVCYVGRTSGSGCGRIFRRQGKGGSLLICARVEVQHGDSGGPVFTRPRRGRTRAVGIVAAKRLDLPGPWGPQGELCYTPIQSVLKAFDAKLATGAFLAGTGGVVA